MQIDCGAPAHRISPLLYGIGYYPLTDAKDGFLWDLVPTARRWGGNHSSRYNWRLGNAWNAADDWFFRNVDYTGVRGFDWRHFVRANQEHEAATALTIPMIGWVAKDTRSTSFPISVYGRQQAADPHHPDAGNGRGEGGKLLRPGPPSRTSVRSTPADIEAWVREIRAYDRKRGRRSVDLYILDNEPMLWHKTHRDVHPEPVSYDELLERTVAYARAIRRADPEAAIAGPALWGWPAYFFSAVDAEAGFSVKPDRRAHGDVPLLAWYLRELRRHEQRTGERLLDVVDVHYYPQDLPKDAVDPAARARRLRATRSLWDPAYEEESWIDAKVELLPRLSRLIQENYPGRRIAIGEYNFGGEGDMSGALALAEVLGRLGQHPGVHAAFYWTYPSARSPAFWAFRAFRNYDGRGGRFSEISLPTKAPLGTSLFASRDASSRRVVAIALNFDPQVGHNAAVTFAGCGAPAKVTAYRYEGGAAGLHVAAAAARSGGIVATHLPPYSITVLEVTTAAVAAGG